MAAAQCRPPANPRVLSAAHRMSRTADFTTAVRSGARCGGPRIVVHHAPAPDRDPVPGSAPTPALVGFVVSRQVGGSVLRHRVSRRLRAQVAHRLIRLPAGSRTVIRALPRAADATSTEFAADLERAFDKLLGGAGSWP